MNLFGWLLLIVGVAFATIEVISFIREIKLRREQKKNKIQNKEVKDE